MQDDGKPFPPPEKVFNADGRVCLPIENGNSNGSSRWSFLRKSRKSAVLSITCSSDANSKTALFGQLLSKVCSEEEKLPKPITEILTLLMKKGCTTEGVFRKPGNNKCLKEIKGQLNDGLDVDMKAKPVVLLAALFKDFLRELPGSLLVEEMSKDWMSALDKEKLHERCTELRNLTESLPKPNTILLQNLLCVLHHISKNANINKMDARNLAVCIAPNLLQCGNLSDLDKVIDLTQFLIENCCEIFGEQIQSLLGDPEEEELADTSDSVSSHQHDSAYDSTDPDADGEFAGATEKQQAETSEDKCQRSTSSACKEERSAIPSCPSNAIFHTFTKPFSRRCSEPILFQPAGMSSISVHARSHEDFSKEKESFFLGDQRLKKQNSDSVLRLLQGERTTSIPEKLGGNLTTEPAVPSKDCSYSSSCSLESSFSNISETSVFTSSPLASPRNIRKTNLECEEVQRHEVKMRSQSMRSDRRRPLRAKSLGAFSYKGSFKKGDSQKETIFACETLQEDSQSEVELTELAPRQRPLSAVEVFQHVDSRIPRKPPSYEQAIQSGLQPPAYRRMTVQDALLQKRRSRPSSGTEELLHSCPVNTFTDCYPQIQDIAIEGIPRSTQSTQMCRYRAMSESVSRAQLDRVSRRCNQRPFEDISYAKESYV
ncbi:T-cell activation Rho GTPase-activating protein-like [Scleropages formosus]|uniref:T-cell activation Rho GTPase-activating protein-like n=1 Tax=Scleropages formosus TaxID=113540 RepID=A0A0P7UH12_SCLFO|nr:T-cell activation Rho GTPase-activating protein-like [Scleropages formosus]